MVTGSCFYPCYFSYIITFNSPGFDLSYILIIRIAVNADFRGNPKLEAFALEFFLPVFFSETLNLPPQHLKLYPLNSGSICRNQGQSLTGIAGRDLAPNVYYRVRCSC